MIYLLLIFAATIFMFIFLMTKHKTRQTALLFCVILFYITALSLFVLYLCKDSFHLGVFLNYFPFPRSIIVRLYALKIPKSAIIRLLQICCLLFMISNIMFAVTFLPKSIQKCHKKMFIGFGIFYLIQFLLYDPYIYCTVYSFLYPKYFSSLVIMSFYSKITSVTSLANLTILIACLVTVFYSVIQTPPIQMLKLAMKVMFVSYTMLIVSYLFLLIRLPTLLVRYSKIADTITYYSLTSRNTMSYYKYFPYVLFVFLIIFAISVFRLNSMRTQLDNHSFEVMRNIEAANVSSRVFCHFMKNEILSISAGIEDLVITEEDKEAIAHILSHCEQLYERLDGIHKSARDNAMTMRQVPIDSIISAALKSVNPSKKLDGFEVSVKIPKDTTYVFVDPVYFEQALINLIFNASDAILQAPKEKKLLTIEVHQGIQWVTIDVKDNGCGIEKKNMVNIFTPLFSSKPMTKNWGVGLSLTYKIITAFNGRIDVKSEVGIGTTFEILLPTTKMH